MADFRAILHNTVDTFIANNTQAVKTKDYSLFSAVLAEGCVRLYRPLSFINRYSQFFKSEITNADYEAQMKIELQVMKDVSQNITRVIIDTEQRAAVIWSEQTVFTVDGKKNVVEVVWDLSFSEDGSRVAQIMEYVDTHESGKVLEEMLSRAAAAP
jgi:hypothetical protein